MERWNELVRPPVCARVLDSLPRAPACSFRSMRSDILHSHFPTPSHTRPPHHSAGTVVFADISGFTALGEKLLHGASRATETVDMLVKTKSMMKNQSTAGDASKAAERLQAELNALLSEMVTCAIVRLHTIHTTPTSRCSSLLPGLYSRCL